MTIPLELSFFFCTFVMNIKRYIIMEQKYTDFKENKIVRVAECYLTDEVTENIATSDIAIICTEPSDDEELVGIIYESGTLDYVPQYILEILNFTLQETEKKIFLGGGIIDFYVNRKKYNSYKTETGRMNYVKRVLDDFLHSMVGKTLNGVTLRDLTITSNHFWSEKYTIIPDLAYSYNNMVKQVPDDSENIPLRIFNIDITAITTNTEPTKCFFEYSDEGFYLHISNVKLV